MDDYKIVVLGSGGVGKSALAVQLTQGLFLEKYDPTLEDFYKKSVEVDGQNRKLEILDTAGIEQFQSLRDNYRKWGQGFVLVYDITSQASYSALEEEKNAIFREKDTDKIPMIVVGNKCDLEDERVVSKDQGMSLATEFNAAFLETSAKSKLNVIELFANIVRQIDKKLPKKQKKSRSHRCLIS